MTIGYIMKKVALSKQALQEKLKKESPQQIADSLGCNVETIRRRIREYNIVRSRHSHLIKEDYFKEWSRNMSYILGFTYADGSINTTKHHSKLVFQLQKSDEEVLNFIKQEIQPNRRIYHYERFDNRTENTYAISMIDFSSKILIKDLKEIGIISNKTYDDRILPNIPNKYWWDFVRGWFDGDGSISINSNKKAESCYICCNSYNMLSQAQERMGFGVLSNSDNPSRLNFYSKADIQSLFHNMYNGNFCLTRKFNKFKELING